MGKVIFLTLQLVSPTEVHISQDVGSVGYKPPEYLQNKPCDARQFDLWALGCCLFKMTTGEPAGSQPGPGVIEGHRPGGMWRGATRTDSRTG